MNTFAKGDKKLLTDLLRYLFSTLLPISLKTPTTGEQTAQACEIVISTSSTPTRRFHLTLHSAPVSWMYLARTLRTEGRFALISLRALPSAARQEDSKWRQTL